MRSVVSRPCWVLAAVALGAPACGDPPARVTLVPIAHPTGCGRPAGANAVRITAYARSGEITRAVGLDEQVDIADFPADTEQLGVEVVVGGGAIGAQGKTAPLEFAELADGTEIPVFMAPPSAFCPTVTPMTEARVAPLLARVAAGVLVIGGHDGQGTYLATAELYDPATGTFTPVAVPDVLGENGFAGTAVATLADGMAAISGGPQPVITLFEPGQNAFRESVLIEARAFHTSIATDAQHVLVAGGCSDVVAGACAGVTRRSTKLYDVTDLGVAIAGPALDVGRTGAAIFDTGIRRDGQRSYVVAGGSPDPAAPTAADRFALTDDRSVAIAGTHVQAAALDGGAILTAFAADADAPDGAASVIVPDQPVARAIARAPDLAGVRLLRLEDGRVAGIGGPASPAIVIFEPTAGRWQTVTPVGPAPGTDAAGVPVAPVHAPSMIALPDGSLLVLGGSYASGLPSRDAWIYRPSLIGPASGSVTVVPTGTTTTVLTATDPDTVSRTPDWQLTASDELARALVGGPRMTTGSVQATVRVREGGVALLARHAGPGEELVAELSPGAPARVVHRTGGELDALCSGPQVVDFAPALPVTLRFEVAGERVRVLRDGAELLACDVGGTARGAWGVAALGPGSRVTIDTVTVAR